MPSDDSAYLRVSQDQSQIPVAQLDASLWRRQFGDAESRQLLSDWTRPRHRNFVDVLVRTSPPNKNIPFLPLNHFSTFSHELGHC